MIDRFWTAFAVFRQIEGEVDPFTLQQKDLINKTLAHLEDEMLEVAEAAGFASEEEEGK